MNEYVRLENFEDDLTLHLNTSIVLLKGFSGAPLACAKCHKRALVTAL
jgi:hypothetical protein